MSDGEQKLLDAAGDYCSVVRDGQPVDSPQWRSSRIVLTSDRTVLATNDGTRAIPHAQSRLADPDVLPETVDATDATAFRTGDAVFLVDPGSGVDFAAAYRRAVLHDAVVLARHRAVVGGVVQEDTDWSKARVRFDDDRVVLGLPGGRRATFPVDDVGSVERRTETVRGTDRPVVVVEHTDDEDHAVETHFSGTDRHVETLAALLRDVLEARDDDVDLSETESQVLMALYSGVSPFEMADFVGLDVDEVEAVYQHLLEVGAVDEVRTRTEVALNATGRNLASEAMNEQ